MDKLIIIKRSVICFICFFFLMAGCDKKAEPPPKVRGVTKKIVIAKKDTSKPDLKQETAEPKPEFAYDISKAEDGVSDRKLVASVSMTSEKNKTPRITDFYDSEGKLDPFAPLIKEKPVVLPVKHKKAVRQKILTPLEKLELGQLKLVGIIRAASGNKALVEEDSGKGYVIKKGTYIGIHSGKVAKVLPDRIIVEEEVEDIYGKASIRKIEIKLKPPGEE